MFCSQCGTKAIDGANFCTKCGNTLAKKEVIHDQSSQEHTSVIAPETGVKYAGFWIRYVALLLDGFILGFGIGIVIVGIIMLFPVDNVEAFMPAKYMWLYVILYWLILWGYFIYFTYTKGATLGKRALGLQVVSTNGEKLTLEKVIIRETIGRFVSHILLDIGYIVAAFTAKKQALHDTMAGTYVIYKDPKHKNNAWIIAIILAPILLAVVGIVAAIVLASLGTAREKTEQAAFKAEVSAINSQVTIVCSERWIEYVDIKNAIKTKGEYINAKETFDSLDQDCGEGSSYMFYYSVQGKNKYAQYRADCSEVGCSFHSTDRSLEGLEYEANPVYPEVAPSMPDDQVDTYYR